VEKFKNRKSYQSILEASKALFWKFGVKRVSVEEICKHAGVSKMTFYRMFKNKQALVKTLLDKIASEGLQSYQQIMASDISFPEKVKQMILEKRKNSEGISQEFMRDVFMSEDLELVGLFTAHQEEMKKALVKDLTKAQQEGWIRKDLSMEFIMYMLEDMQAKASDQRFLGLHKDNLQEAIMEMTNFFFYGVTPEKDHKSE
jgi:AcrR family transcriptional regulator